MGVPKFFRWLSERYPCINENVNEYNMPEFDYFYVDMNGIFHICSHPIDDVHFRIPESKIFENIGIDGVAPRSKMNQQRSRRFKSAKEAIEKEAKAKQMGETLPNEPRFDSNCITPGTEFMQKLHVFLIDFIAKKIQTCQNWREIDVIYSGYDVPGEGEHKILDYIRYCKTQHTFNPDTKHCLYGLDADLINLGLSTHEPYFSVLREEVTYGKKSRLNDPLRMKFQLLHLSLLRRYIYHEFQELEDKLKFNFNLEKIIDDWILLNLLIGNDFLPHVPRFHINKDGIQILYNAYKAVLPTLDGYINDSGILILERYQKFLIKLSEYDHNLFNQNSIDLKYLDDFSFDEMNNISFGCGLNFESIESIENNSDTDSLTDSTDKFNTDEFLIHKNNYYMTKLNFEDLSNDVEKMVYEYIKGIQWVLYYYFDGCPSWGWYYPYHYGPYVSDLATIDPNIEFNFKIGKPFQPLVQLLAVLPQDSKELLPKTFQKLTYYPDSPLIEYFPNEFKTDLNEKRHDYEAIILLPFMDQDLLIQTFEKYQNTLTEEEINRNRFGSHHLMKYSEYITENAFDVNKFPNVVDKSIPKYYYILPREIIYKGIRRNINENINNGFPSFNGIKYSVKLDMTHIHLYDYPSPSLTMMIKIEKDHQPENIMKLMENYLHKIVYINWPLLSEAKLIGFVDGNYLYLKNGKSNLSSFDLKGIETLSRNYCNTMKNKHGIVVDSVECMAKVLPLNAQRYIITQGKMTLHKEWSKCPLYVPIELVIFNTFQSWRTMPKCKSLNDIFIKNKSFYLISNPYYGYKAHIINYIAKENIVLARVCVTSEPDFSEIALEYGYIMRNNYFPENKLAIKIKQELNLPENIIKRLLGSVYTQYENNKGRIKRLNIGLKLKYKFNWQIFCIPGYSCVDNNEIFYNKKVILIFMEYYKKFPEIFKMLLNNMYKTSFDVEDMFPDNDVDTRDKIKRLLEIKDWIDSHEFSQTCPTFGNAEYLDNCIVEAMEERIESHMVLMSEENTFNHKFLPSSFYIPEFILKGNQLPDDNVIFELFDRVVNVKNLLNLPFGAKGTVVGIYYEDDLLDKYKELPPDMKNSKNNERTLMSSTIEVMFDEPFDGGYTNRSTKSNILMMNPSYLINISYGIRTSKESVNFRNVYQSIQPTNRGQSNYNKRGYHQYNNYNNYSYY